MVEIVFGATVGRDLQALGVGINQTAVLQTSGGPVVVSLSGAEGGLVTLAFDAGGQAYVSDRQYFSTDFWAATTGRLDLIVSGAEVVAVTASQGRDRIFGYRIEGNQIAALTSLSAEGIVGTGRTLYQQSGGFLFGASGDGGLHSLRALAAGGLTAAETRFDTASGFHAQPGAMASIVLQGRHFLLTTGLRDVGVSAFELDQSTGHLTQVAAVGRATGLGLFDKPIAVETTVLGGQGYMVVASAAETGIGAALSVIAISPDGQLRVTDHILDSLATRFGRVTGLSVVEHNGWSYVIAQGGDMGVSLFSLMPGGQLLHLTSFAGSATVDLTSQSSLSALMIGDQLQIIVATHAATGFTQLHVDLSTQGLLLQADAGGAVLNGATGDDMLVGGAGRDTLSGGAGADILRDGAGEDWLIGGAGRDVFVLEPDGLRDVIADFDPAQDKIDLSLVPMLYSTAQIQVSTRPWGAVLTYRGEELELRSASGTALSEGQITAALVWATDRPPMALYQQQPMQPGNDTLLGSAGSNTIHGDAGNDELHGLAGDDGLDGKDGDDRVYAGDGNDTVFGGVGNDQLYGDAGNDLIFGGANFDTIFGGDGNDTVAGDDGRDLVFLNQGNDLFTDNGQGGVLGRDTVFAGLGDDTIQGGNGDDEFYGEWGNDLIVARLGNDRVFGGDGFDTIYAGDGNDTVAGGNGRDLVFLNQGNDLFTDNGQGGVLGRDTVFAGLGDDTIQGGNGDDMFYGEAGNDVIFARFGNDTVFAGDNFDFIDAGDGNDLVFAGNGRDTVFLGAGDDVYVDTAQAGALGQDTITGGTGADHFEFQGVMSADVITDFDLGVDVLRLSQSLWGGGLSAAVLISTYATVEVAGVLLDFGGNQSILLQGLTSTAGLDGDILLV